MSWIRISIDIGMQEISKPLYKIYTMFLDMCKKSISDLYGKRCGEEQWSGEARQC